MFSRKAATQSSTLTQLAPTRGRRREHLTPGQAFIPLRPLGWGAQLNHAVLTLTAAVLFAPQVVLHPAALLALPVGAYFISGAIARIVHRHNNPARLRRWARKYRGAQISTADAVTLLGGGATATHAAALHGDHLHLTPIHVRPGGPGESRPPAR
jgi:hypothetical protein